MKKRGKTLTPRNPFALAARLRKGGAHDKRFKVKRRDDKQELKVLLKQKEKDDESSFSFCVAEFSLRSA
jgi:hypothetical protein